MARFYGTLQGVAKQIYTARGHNKLIGHIRGWNGGIAVECTQRANKTDVITTYLTGGTNNEQRLGVLVTVQVSPTGEITVTYPKSRITNAETIPQSRVVANG